MLFSPVITKAETTALQRLLLINDLEAYLNGGKSLVEWNLTKVSGLNVNYNVVSIGQIYWDYRRNVFNAESKYGKGFQFISTPSISSVKRSKDGSPVIAINIDYVNHIYIAGLSANEASALDPYRSTKLLCYTFNITDYEDMSVACTSFKSVSSFIAVNHIQSKSFKEKLSNNNRMNKVLAKIDNFSISADTVDYINRNCNIVDSVNYDTCMRKIADPIDSAP